MGATAVTPVASPAGSSTSPARSRTYRALRGLQFLAVQTGIQIVTLACGVLLVNRLPPADFAVFTVATAAFNILAVVADGGVMSAMMALGAEIRSDRVQTRALIEDVLRFRAVFTLIGFVACTVFSTLALTRLGLDPAFVAIVVATCAMYGAAATVQAVWSVVLRLQSAFMALQRFDATAVVLRLLIVLIVVALGSGSMIAVASSLLPFVLVSVLCWRAGRAYAANEAPHGAYTERIRPIVKSAFPAVLFFAFQGQLTVGLMGLMGSSTEVASAGALARVATVFSPLGPLLANVMAPRFAMLPSERVRRVFWSWGAAVVVLSLTITFFTYAAATPILAVLGPPYRSLRVELTLCMAIAALAFVETFVGLMNKARGWMRLSWTIFPLTLGLQGLALTIWDVGDLRGALTFSLVGGIGRLAAGFVQAHVSMRRLHS